MFWLVLVVYLILHALRERTAFGRLAPPRQHGAAASPSVAVIVPARDEGANIGRCLASLAAQDYPRLSVVVVDDDSADDTTAIVAEYAARDRRVTLLRAPRLPPGWKGKTNACATGAAAAQADWLCFLDADMCCRPPLIAAAMQRADDANLDCLSLSPRHELVSFAERLMIPCGLFMLAFSQNLAQIQESGGNTVSVTGQFMLMRREIYEAVGGHAAVRNSICEDYDLAMLFKRGGKRVLLEDGSDLLSTRMYTGWRDLWPGLTKNLSHMFGGPLATSAVAIAALVIGLAAVLLPLYDASSCAQGSTQACLGLVPALLASAAAFAMHIAGAAYFGIPVAYGLLFPLGYMVGAVVALDSVRRSLTGRISWKGRVYQ